MRTTRRFRYFLEFTGLLAFAGMARALPRRWALVMGRGVGAVGWLLRLRQRVVLENLDRVFPDKSKAEKAALAKASCLNFGRAATEFARFAKDRDRVSELVDVVGVEELAEACKDEGAVVITGHLGAWALYVTALAARGVPTALLVGKQSNPRVDRFIHSLPGDAVSFIGKGPLAPRGVLRGLAEQRAVLMVADQHSRVGIEVAFLGHPCRTLSLPGAIVAKKDCPLFLMEGYHLGAGHHRVELQRLSPPAEGAGDRALAIAELCNQAIGAAVLRHPDQYFWHHRRWRPVNDTTLLEAPLA